MKRTCVRSGVKDQLDHYTMYEPNSGCTHADNIADRDAKGRHVPAYGERNGYAKLSSAKASLIKSATGSQKAIGELFGVCQQTVSNIKRGKIWTHI